MTDGIELPKNYPKELYHKKEFWEELVHEIATGKNEIKINYQGKTYISRDL